MLPIPWQDLVLGIGMGFGLWNKAYALSDADTTWSRKASLPDALWYIPSIIAFASLGLYLTAALATCSMCLWFGIALFRAGDE